MGWLGRLFGRRTKVRPQELAYTAIALARSHAEALGKELSGQGTDDQWADVAAEIFRAYFALASLHASRSIHESPALNRYGAAMLDALRCYPEDGGNLIRETFADDEAIYYAVRLYVQGHASEEDLTLVQSVATLFRLDFKNPLMMVCAYCHVRALRHLDIGKTDQRFFVAWIVNSHYMIGAFNQVFGRLEAVP